MRYLLMALLLGLAQYAIADIKIGVAGPHTGAYAPFGEQLWRGATEAVKALNQAGGINGERVIAVKADDACDPEQAVTLADRLINIDRVSAVVGHFCSATTIPASEKYNKVNILMITPASTNPQVTDRGLPVVFRVAGRDDHQGIVAGNYIIDKLKAKRIAVIHDKDLYGKGLADATRAQLKSRGVREVLYDSLTRGEQDFSVLAAKIDATNPDVVYFGGLHLEAGYLLHHLRKRGSNAWFISGAGIASGGFVEASGGGPFLNRVLMTFYADPRNPQTNPAGVDLVKAFRAAGYEPEGYTLHAYTALQVIAAALKAQGGKAGGAALGAWIKRNSIPTVMGVRKFDDKGDLTVSDYVMYRWNTDGTYKQL